MTDLNPELIERARRVLVDEGADSEGGWHSWRCFDRERYPEPCDCTAEISRAILEGVAPLIAAQTLEDAAEVFGENQMIREGDVKEWLRNRAAKLRGVDQ